MGARSAYTCLATRTERNHHALRPSQHAPSTTVPGDSRGWTGRCRIIACLRKRRRPRTAKGNHNTFLTLDKTLSPRTVAPATTYASASLATSVDKFILAQVLESAGPRDTPRTPPIATDGVSRSLPHLHASAVRSCVSDFCGVVWALHTLARYSECSCTRRDTLQSELPRRSPTTLLYPKPTGTLCRALNQ